MPDDKENKNSPDSKRINVNQPYEIQYWCEKLGCTEKELIDAVNEVGALLKK